MVKKILKVNGVERHVVVNQDALLSDVIRKQLQLTGTKVGCGTGTCGACNVILNGKLVRTCVTRMKRVENWSEITTVEGIGTPQNLHPIQKAIIKHGALQCGFCTPGFVVSIKALLDVNPNPDRQDVRDWFTKYKNACRCVGYMSLVDAAMDAAKVLRGDMDESVLEYKDISNGSLYGTRYPRPTSVAKVCGLWDFGADKREQLPEGTLFCSLVYADVAHANINGVDTSEAEKMPGVVKIVTAKDIQGKNRITGLITFPTNKGDGWERPILCDKKVFQYGDAIAIVCAQTQAQADEAAKAVKLDLEVLPHYMNAMAAIAEDAIEIHPGTPNLYFTQGLKKGEETAPIMEKAAHVVEGEYYLGRQPQMPLESDIGFAYTNEDGKVVVCSKSIAIQLHVAMIAPGLGLDPENLVVVQNPCGSSFGYKFCPSNEALVAAATMATGVPCYLEYSWAQLQFYTGKRSPFWFKAKLAADENGKFLATETEWYVDHGPYSEFGDLLTIRGMQYAFAGYDIANMRGEGHTVATNHCWGAPFRAYGSPQSFFASESLIDELAKKMGKDPFELRELNCYREGATTPTQQTPEVFVFPKQFEALRPKYERAKQLAEMNSTETKKRGVGVSLGIYGCGLDGPDTSEAWAELLPNNEVMIGNSWQDHGQGADIGTLTFAHETLKPLGLKPEQINLCMNDSSMTPNSGPSGGSRHNLVTGNAIRVACEMLLEGMKKADGSYRSYDEMQTDGIDTKYLGKWTTPCTDCDVETGAGDPFCVYMYGLFLSEVEVDITTGKTKVIKMTHVADVGTITNQLAVDGQIYGGLAQGIGLALTEDFEHIQKHSNMIGAGFPFCNDITDDLEIIYVCEPREHGAFGAGGVGELPLTAPHCAIINAIDDACGARIRHLPAYPEKVLAALNSKKKAFDVADAIALGYTSDAVDSVPPKPEDVINALAEMETEKV
ncbi:aldehyde oxidoreductase [Syntrophotalea acetylenivorans]|uniref:Aldehyde oxidoreductase n=1 Tax=Syntrophotalea acetylenivorans TaxID=1842532 RepID=A0A1L3GT44_9BACT|nr:aldehyde oxidoreductase [Syntrophotalea acetylenivorans]